MFSSVMEVNNLAAGTSAQGIRYLTTERILSGQEKSGACFHVRNWRGASRCRKVWMTASGFLANRSGVPIFAHATQRGIFGQGSTNEIRVGFRSRLPMIESKIKRRRIRKAGILVMIISIVVTCAHQ